MLDLVSEAKSLESLGLLDAAAFEASAVAASERFPWRHRCDKDGWVGWRTCWTARTPPKPSIAIAVVTVLRHGQVVLWL